MESTNIGNQIKKYRKLKRMNQQELAKFIGVSQGAITKWENGKSDPNSLYLKKLANIFSVSVDELLGMPSKQATPDLIESVKNARTFDGKHYSDEDAETIADIISAYLKRKK